MRCFASYSPCFLTFCFHSPILGASAQQVFTHYKKALTCPKSPLCCLAILVAKLSSMGKIYPVRVLFHKLPLTCPTIHFQPLLKMSEKSLTIPVHKVPFMDSQNYPQSIQNSPKTVPFYGLKKLPSTMSENYPSPFKTVRKTTPFMDSENPCHWCLPRVRARYLSINQLSPYAAQLCDIGNDE